MKSLFYKYKKILFLAGILLCMIPQSVVAQSSTKPMNLRNYDNEPYHFGFILAYNQMSYSFNYTDNYQMVAHESTEYPNTADQQYDANALYYVRSIESIPQPGFTVGVVGNLRLGKYFDLRLIPSLSFGTRTIEYKIHRERNAREMNYNVKKSIFSTFVEFPLQVKYRSKRLNNVAAYVLAGSNFKIDLASQKKDKATNASGMEITDNIRVKRADLAAELGAGFDFYTGYFKFGIEVKMGFGLINILDHQNILYDSSLKSANNRTFQVSLTFE